MRMRAWWTCPVLVSNMQEVLQACLMCHLCVWASNWPLETTVWSMFGVVSGWAPRYEVFGEDKRHVLEIWRELAKSHVEHERSYATVEVHMADRRCICYMKCIWLCQST